MSNGWQVRSSVSPELSDEANELLVRWRLWLETEPERAVQYTLGDAEFLDHAEQSWVQSKMGWC